MKLPELPRYELLQTPTLLQRLERTERALRRPNLYVKRDDLMPIAMGGNKLRSLEYWLGAALRQQADVVLVAGAPISNLCRLTAAAASMAGLECIVLHSGVEDPPARRASFLNRLFGASVRYLGAVDELRRAQAVEQTAAELRKQGRRPYIIGDEGLGALGYVRAAQELFDQCRQNDPQVRHVLLPGSMGPTEAGFALGNALLGHPFEVHLVSVEYALSELAARLSRCYRAAAALMQTAAADAPPLDERRIHYHMDYLGAGYARPSPESEAAILWFARTEGILLEHIYSAKTFACFLDLARGGTLGSDEAVCVFHTGGVPALFTQFESFRTLPLEGGG